MKKILFVLFLFGAAQRAASQDTPHLRVSLITCAPGDELYSLFGHTAIRITDSIHRTDFVYNYGTFDFNDPDFYVKFTRGKLDYMLSVSSLPEFLYEYQVDKRTVTEQELQLSAEEKQNIQRTLERTLSSSARYYKYDFLYNNCTSRVRDLLLSAGLKPDQPLVPSQTTFRDLLHQYLDGGAQPWSKFGIDLLLASPIDKKMTITESMFLPDYLMKGVDSSVRSSNGGILAGKVVLNAGQPSSRTNRNWPLVVFTLVALVMITVPALKSKFARRVSRMMDMLLFLVTGLVGFLLLFMWFGTDHKACAYNYNVWWALPSHVVAAFGLWKNPRWMQRYFLFCAGLNLALILCWFFLPQQLNIALLPVVILLMQRCWSYRKPARLR